MMLHMHSVGHPAFDSMVSGIDVVKIMILYQYNHSVRTAKLACVRGKGFENIEATDFQIQ